MKRSQAALLIFSLALFFPACHRGKKVVLEEARPGRDRELLEQGLTELNRNRNTVGQLLLQTLINTYPDSPFLPMAKLAIADSFYVEGTSESLAQAEVEYTDFANFFPTHPLADDALFQVALAKMRRIQAPDRDQKPTKEAERRLLQILQRYPNTDLKDQIQQRLKEVREVLAEHEMNVGRHYMVSGRLKGARGRLMKVIQQYPTYSKFDEALWRLGKIYFDDEDPEEAAKYFAWLAREFPNSEYRKRAAEMLEKIGKPVPEPVPFEIARADDEASSKGFLGAVWGKVKNLLGSPGLDVPKEGILLKRGETAEELIAAATSYSKPSTVVTPASTSVAVGLASPGASSGAVRGQQELRIGGAPSTSAQTQGSSPSPQEKKSTGPTEKEQNKNKKSRERSVSKPEKKPK